MHSLSLNPNVDFSVFGDINYIQDEYGNVFFTSEEIGKHLGYTEPKDAVLKIFERNQNELEEFSVTVKLTATDGKKYDTRVYSEEGVYLISMLARTEKAIDFRRKVSKLLKALREGKIQKACLAYYRQGILDSLYTHLPEKRLMRAEQSVMLSGDGMTHKNASDLLGCHPSTVAKDKKVFSYIFGEDDPEPSGTLGVVKKHIDGTANENTYIEGKE